MYSNKLIIKITEEEHSTIGDLYIYEDYTYRYDDGDSASEYRSRWKLNEKGQLQFLHPKTVWNGEIEEKELDIWRPWIPPKSEIVLEAILRFIAEKELL